MAKRTKKPTLELRIGDYVAIGSTRASYPLSWIKGQILWADDSSVLISRSDPHGHSWREVHHLAAVRAIGDYSHVREVEQKCFEATKALQARIRDAEAALGQARNDLFAMLDELSNDGLAVIPPDFEEIDRAETADRGAFERAEEATERELQAAM